MGPFPAGSSALPHTLVLVGIPVSLSALGRVARLVQSPASALFLAFHPYLAARPAGSVQAGRRSGQGP